MNSKAKLISTIAAICMVLVLLVGGIWAASTATVNVGGSVSFNANDVKVTVTGKVEGAKVNTWTKEVTWDETNSETTLTANWTDLNLEFVKSTDGQGALTGELDDIVITITITNLDEQRALNVTLKDNTTGHAGFEVELSETSDTLNKVDGAKDSAEYTITLKPTGADTTATGTLAVTIGLAAGNIEA